MSFTDEKTNGFYMPVAPAGYGAGNGGLLGGMGGDWFAWLILVLLIGGNGWGFGGGFGGGMMPWLMGGMGGGFGIDYLYPWLNNSEHISDGFRDQQLNTQIGDLRTDVNRGFGDVQLGLANVNQNICQTGNNITGAVRDGFYSAEIAANQRQMADMQQNFALQSQLADCCCKNQTGLADLKYTVATENCADRAALNDIGRDIIAAQNAASQRQIDNQNMWGQKLLDAQRDQILYEERRENDRLSRQIEMQNLAASQLAQDSRIINGVYNRLSECPVDSRPVYGRTPIFTCNNGCGCGAA